MACERYLSELWKGKLYSNKDAREVEYSECRILDSLINSTFYNFILLAKVNL